MDKLQKANRLMEDLIDQSMSDKEISEEEKKILFCINDYLNDYVRIIITSISDNKITEDEKKQLKEIEQNIISDAKKIAMEDSHLSDDEKALLETLVEAVNDLSME